MFNRLVFVLTEEPAHPTHALAFDDVVSVDPLFKVRHVGNVSADEDRGLRQVLADKLAHLAHLLDIGDDRADSNNLIVVRRDLANKPLQIGEVQERARRVYVGLNQHQSPGAMEHTQRERPLYARYLVVKQLHGVDLPAAILVIPGVWPENAREQNPCP